MAKTNDSIVVCTYRVRAGREHETLEQIAQQNKVSLAWVSATHQKCEPAEASGETCQNCSLKGKNSFTTTT